MLRSLQLQRWLRQRQQQQNASAPHVSCSRILWTRESKTNTLLHPRHRRKSSFRDAATVSGASSSGALKDDDDEKITAHLVNKEQKTLTRQQPKGGLTKAYMDLAKAKLSGLVVATTAAGFIAAGGPISSQLDVLGSVVVGTALCSSSAAALNQIIERDRDAKMKRTQQRPLVTGALTVSQATTAAAVWGAAGTSLLLVGTNTVTTALGASNILLYAGAYTQMKPISIYNTWVGAVVGAVPPVMGWAAATGGSLWDVEAILLGIELYLWQMPHFFALSYMHRVDYKRGGFVMVPCLEEDGQKTASLIVRYAWYQSAVPFVATAAQVTSSMFALEGIALNAYALYVAHKFQRERTNANARKVFLTSLWYLPSLLMLFLLHSKVWDEEKDQDDAIAKFLADHIHYLRNRGRELCVHETAATQNTSKEACPITVGSVKSKKTTEAIEKTAETVKSTLNTNNNAES